MFQNDNSEVKFLYGQFFFFFTRPNKNKEFYFQSYFHSEPWNIVWKQGLLLDFISKKNRKTIALPISTSENNKKEITIKWNFYSGQILENTTIYILPFLKLIYNIMKHNRDMVKEAVFVLCNSFNTEIEGVGFCISLRICKIQC